MTQPTPFPAPLTPRLAKAIRQTSYWHRDGTRRGSGVPYVEHVLAVALILDRLKYPEDVVIAGLLHDAVEDTEATIDEIAGLFGPRVASLVEHCTEKKRDDQGRKRKWEERKRDHLRAIADAPDDARAIMLADKLHNLLSMFLDAQEGRPVTAMFHAPWPDVLDYHEKSIATLARDVPELEELSGRCHRLLLELRDLAAGDPEEFTADPELAG